MLSTVTQWCHHCQISGAVKSLEVHSTCSCHVYFIGFFSPPSRPIQNTSVLPKGINTARVSCSQCLSFNICCLCCAKTPESSGLSLQAKRYCFERKEKKRKEKKRKETERKGKERKGKERKNSHKMYLKINQAATMLLMQHWLALQMSSVCQKIC